MSKKKELDPRKVAIGERINQIRKAKNLSKENLAKLLNTTGQHLGKAINGEVGLSVEKIIELSEKTGYSTDFILLGKTLTASKEMKDLIKIALEYSEKTCNAMKQIDLITKQSRNLIG